jgi:hypothetical protein
VQQQVVNQAENGTPGGSHLEKNELVATCCRRDWHQRLALRRKYPSPCSLEITSRLITTQTPCSAALLDDGWLASAGHHWHALLLNSHAGLSMPHNNPTLPSAAVVRPCWAHHCGAWNSAPWQRNSHPWPWLSPIGECAL